MHRIRITCKGHGRSYSVLCRLRGAIARSRRDGWHSEAIYAVAFTPDGKYVVSGSGERTVKVWDSATGRDLKSEGSMVK
ncbi:MAG TPA: hypothetical protein VN688_23135 [Gemmataceae bacterium]|nr:hypothetical protein [Gemmataceae bacterium]